MKAAFCTLGCKVNQYETEAVRELFAAAGYDCVGFDEPADVYVVNTCTVTATSDAKSRQMISRAHAENPEAKLVVMGCYAQRAPEEAAKLPGVVLVLGTADRATVVERLAALQQGQFVRDVSHELGFEQLSAIHDGRTRAELKIQDGCDRFCTYCIIPYARGHIRSRSLQGVKEELTKLAQAGFSEVVLTGIHLMSYGRDIGGVTLWDAVEQAADISGIRRIRLGSLEPQLLSDEYVTRMRDNPKLCHQFHLSLQSGSNGVLQRMKRRYTAEEYELAVQRLRAAMPGCAITTDVIAGFPGETEEEHQQTLQFLQRIGFARIHVFPYSRREGTVAASLPGQVQKKVKLSRAKELISLGEKMEREYIQSCIGAEFEVLFEQRKDGLWEGYTDTYVRVAAEDGKNLAGELHKVYMESAKSGRLLGKIID